METADLIKVLAADNRRHRLLMPAAWRFALALAVLVAAVTFFATLGPRDDVEAAAGTLRFLFKFVFTIALATAAFRLADGLSRPGRVSRGRVAGLAIAPALLVLAVLVELVATPPASWAARLVGVNGVACLALVSLIGLAPLALLLLALRHGAPSNPTVAGAIAGVLAGGIAATFYAVHCTDDSPLFVALWYTGAIGLLAALGALGGRKLLKW